MGLMAASSSSVFGKISLSIYSYSIIDPHGFAFSIEGSILYVH